MSDVSNVSVSEKTQTQETVKEWAQLAPHLNTQSLVFAMCCGEWITALTNALTMVINDLPPTSTTKDIVDMLCGVVDGMADEIKEFEFGKNLLPD